MVRPSDCGFDPLLLQSVKWNFKLWSHPHVTGVGGTLNTNKHNICCLYAIHMGESFQDYSWIQDFEADFPQKVGLNMLN